MLIVATLAWGFASGASAGTLLDDLATNANIVATSPFATGGDLILKLGDKEYVHVFADTQSAAKFAPSIALTARVVLVGGGGGAGRAVKHGAWQFLMAGGGGGGGVSNQTDVALSAGTAYDVTIGVGGAGASSTSATGTSGGSTTFAGGSVSLSVLGGGGGGSASSSAANNCGLSAATGGGASGYVVSGGGTASVGTPGAGSANGYAGGTVTIQKSGALDMHILGGGGGGAGGVGQPGQNVNKGSGVVVGGLGVVLDVLGSDVGFGGGGAGGSHSVNGGGAFRNLGVHGGGTSYANSYATATDPCNATAGADGYGGGGAGGWAAGGSDSLNGCKGGSGSVMVRYTATTSETGAYVVSAKPISAGGVRALFEGEVDFNGDTSATVDIVCTPTAGSPVVRSVSVSSANGSHFLISLNGLTAGVAYTWSVRIGSTTACVGTFTPSETPGLSISGDSATTPANGAYEKCFVLSPGERTLTVTEGGYVQLLAIAGGGAGGYDGNSATDGGSSGGGAGGFIYNGRMYLAPGSYALSIGGGGEPPPANWDSRGRGTNTTFRLTSATDPAFSFATITAYGGGRGGCWGENLVSAEVCGSSAGAIRNVSAPPACTPGQGNIGGYVGGTFAAGGGGGAGAPGVSGAANKAGDGGKGKQSGLSGTMQWYAGGGGSGTGGSASAQLPGIGGSGIGGTGYHYVTKTAGTAGVDGTGSGGGGGSGKKGGKGGDGVMVIRYLDGAALSAAADPVIAFQYGEVESTVTSLTFSVALLYPGTGANSADLSARYWISDAFTNNLAKATTVPLASGVEDVRANAYTISGLSPGRTHYVQIVADNGIGGIAESEIVPLTTIGMFSKELKLSTTGGTLTYVVDAASDGTQQMIVMVGPDANSLTNQVAYTEASYLTAGSHGVTPFVAEQFGTTLSILVRHIATVDGVSFTNDTAVLTATLQDAVTYTWNAAVAAGIWQDPANWTATGGSRGYPVPGSTAVFPSASTNAVTLSGRVDIAKLTVLAAGSSVTILGNHTNLVVSTDVTATGANASLVLDNVYLSGSGTFKPGAGSYLELKNGADVNGQSLETSAVNFTWKFGPNCRWRTSGNPSVKGAGSLVEVDDGLLSSYNSLTFSGGTTLRLKGATPGVQARTSFTATGTFDYCLPLESYGNITPTSNNNEALAQQRAPVRKFWTNENSLIGGSTQSITVHINKASPARSRSKPADYCLIDYRQNYNATSQGIYTNCISVTGLRPGEYVYYVKDWSSATYPTRMYVHLESKLGTMIIVR